MVSRTVTRVPMFQPAKNAEQFELLLLTGSKYNIDTPLTGCCKTSVPQTTNTTICNIQDSEAWGTLINKNRVRPYKLRVWEGGKGNQGRKLWGGGGGGGGGGGISTLPLEPEDFPHPGKYPQRTERWWEQWLNASRRGGRERRRKWGRI